MFTFLHIMRILCILYIKILLFILSDYRLLNTFERKTRKTIIMYARPYDYVLHMYCYSHP